MQFPQLTGVSHSVVRAPTCVAHVPILLSGGQRCTVPQEKLACTGRVQVNCYPSSLSAVSGLLGCGNDQIHCKFSGRWEKQLAMSLPTAGRGSNLEVDTEGGTGKALY